VAGNARAGGVVHEARRGVGKGGSGESAGRDYRSAFRAVRRAPGCPRFRRASPGSA
jgi:hypothetical protein